MGFLPGGSEWLIILLVIVILFGAKKIPELMRGLGSGIREFKNAANPNEEKETKNDAPKGE
jgi:sec-independent protein translocase protein TatA